jgi:hypothetical protein
MSSIQRGKTIMKTKALILSGAAPIAALLIAMSAPVVSAQSAAPSTVNGQTIQERKENQQDRIAQGVNSGQLTAGETANLETKESALNKEEHTMRSEDDGHLTAADRGKLTNQQNHLSKNIYRDKHNARRQ